MKKVIIAAILVALGAAATASAETRIPAIKGMTPAQQAMLRARYSHPQVVPVSNQLVRIAVTKDVILRSCCAPPSLVVGGRVTNLSARTIDYVRLIFSFEDDHGRVVFADSIFNSSAVSMADDLLTQKVLNEKPHFDPLRPGASDTFAYSIPYPIVPRHSKVELFAVEMKGGAHLEQASR